MYICNWSTLNKLIIIIIIIIIIIMIIIIIKESAEHMSISNLTDKRVKM